MDPWLAKTTADRNEQSSALVREILDVMNTQDSYSKSVLEKVMDEIYHHSGAYNSTNTLVNFRDIREKRNCWLQLILDILYFRILFLQEVFLCWAGFQTMAIHQSEEHSS